LVACDIAASVVSLITGVGTLNPGAQRSWGTGMFQPSS
jgi:hypothetical protein